MKAQINLICLSEDSFTDVGYIISVILLVVAFNTSSWNTNASQLY